MKMARRRGPSGGILLRDWSTRRSTFERLRTWPHATVWREDDAIRGPLFVDEAWAIVAPAR
jgi:hypothetical protein